MIQEQIFSLDNVVPFVSVLPNEIVETIIGAFIYMTAKQEKLWINVQAENHNTCPNKNQSIDLSNHGRRVCICQRSQIENCDKLEFHFNCDYEEGYASFGLFESCVNLGSANSCHDCFHKYMSAKSQHVLKRFLLSIFNHSKFGLSKGIVDEKLEMDDILARVSWCDICKVTILCKCINWRQHIYR